VCLAFSLMAISSLGCTAAAQNAAASLASADAAMLGGRFSDAARDYEVWLKTHPDSSEVLLALGTCYVQLGRLDEAAAVLRRYVRLVPGSAAGHAVLGIALLDGVRTAEAKAELETAVKLNPLQADAVQALARVYLVEDRAGEAAALLQPLLASGTDDETQALLANALIKGGQAEAASSLFERRLTANPRSAPQTYAMAAGAFLRSGNLSRAAEVCEQGMRLYPDSEIEGVYLSLPAPFLAERIGKRIEHLQGAPEVSELIAVGRVLIAADTARKTRANEIAQRLLAHAIELAPDSASAHYNYGRALRQAGVEGAFQEWEKALMLHPSDELRLQILMQIAGAKLERSDFAGAEQAFREALEINRKLPRRETQPALEYVRFLQLRSRPAEAGQVLREALVWNPLSPEAHAERAKLLAASGDWGKVVDEGEFVLRTAGESMELARTAHLLLARAYYRLKQTQKAQLHESWLKSN
jgi:tetratricopeptide (TPR) repeat protein